MDELENRISSNPVGGGESENRPDEQKETAVFSEQSADCPPVKADGPNTEPAGRDSAEEPGKDLTAQNPNTQERVQAEPVEGEQSFSGGSDQPCPGEQNRTENAEGYANGSAGTPLDGTNPQTEETAASYGQYTPPTQNAGVPPYGAPYGGYGNPYNRPYNGYYHAGPVNTPYGQGQNYAQGQNQNFGQPQQFGYGPGNMPPYGQPPYGQNFAPPFNRQNHPANRPPKKGIGRGLTVFICVVCCVVVGVVGLSIGILAGKKRGVSDNGGNAFSLIEGQEDGGSPSDFDLNTEGNTDRTMTYEQVISSVSNSVVSITVYSSSGTEGSIASGIIMDSDGYVLTNDHIYSEIPKASFLITLNNGTEFKASFISGDKKSDLAILKIENPKGLSPATFATESVKTGEEVLAIGASAGLDGSVTQGIVSAVDRRVSNGTSSEKYIQTTAAINPGTSGGALVNMSGQVVGICSSKYASTDIDNVCFAIPMTRALGVIDQLKEYGKVTNRARLGITYTYINTVAAELKNVPTGLLVKSIDSDSSLKNSGIKENDIITQVDDTDIVSADQVLDIVEKATIGDEVKLTVYSGETGAYFTVTGSYIMSPSSSSYTTEENASSYNTQNPYDFFEEYGK